MCPSPPRKRMVRRSSANSTNDNGQPGRKTSMRMSGLTMLAGALLAGAVSFAAAQTSTGSSTAGSGTAGGAKTQCWDKATNQGQKNGTEAGGETNRKNAGMSIPHHFGR